MSGFIQIRLSEATSDNALYIVYVGATDVDLSQLMRWEHDVKLNERMRKRCRDWKAASDEYRATSVSIHEMLVRATGRNTYLVGAPRLYEATEWDEIEEMVDTAFEAGVAAGVKYGPQVGHVSLCMHSDLIRLADGRE